MATLGDATIAQDRIAVTWSDGRHAGYPFIWLRDNCPCALCRHPANGQRLLDTLDIPDDIGARGLALRENDLTVFWSDGHESRYAGDWLSAHRLTPEARAARRPHRTLWGAEIANDLPRGDWTEIERSPAAERCYLARYVEYGFGLIDNVPARDAMVVEVGNRFGHVRVTNYGAYFDVRSVPDPTNLAYTAIALGVHTDNPYRDPEPGVQLLHCLEADAPGGESILVDGFRAAEDLRRADPDGFARLAQRRQSFRFRDQEADLHARAPVIGLDDDGSVAAIHFNNRSAAPLDAPVEEIAPWYGAYRQFARLLRRSENELRLRLAPRQLLMMQNDRALHGREAFDSSLGRRHLQGCYVDKDGIASRLALLERKLAAA
jgi:gamma-butyrobetaine dioxygenase